MKDLIINNYLLFSSMIGMIVLLFFNRTLDHKSIKIFRMASISIIFLFFCEIADIYLMSYNKINYVRVIASSLGYIIRPFVLLLFIILINRRKKQNILLFIIMIIEAVLVSTSQFTRLVAYFDENNVFTRGPLGLLPHITSFIFMIFMIYYSFKNQMKIDISECIVVLYLELMCVSSIILETYFRYNLLLIRAMTFSIVIYYVFLNTQLYKHDELTGVLNRRCFYLELDYNKNSNIAIISCDMNNLKMINDEQGHEAGDVAIRTMSNALCNAIVKGFKVFRVGGDEFVVLGLQKTEEQAIEYINRVNSIMDKTPYSISSGCAVYHPGDNFDVVYSLSDKKMYENKRAMKMKS